MDFLLRFYFFFLFSVLALSGHHRVVYPNGDVYEGEWRDGDAEGKGVLTYANGVVYNGEWSFSRWHGYGTLTWPNGDTYEGTFEDNKMEGSGIFKSTGIVTNNNTNNNNSTPHSSAASSSNNFHIRPTSPSPSNPVSSSSPRSSTFLSPLTSLFSPSLLLFEYDGQFSNNLPSGYGKCTYASGDVYEGYFVAGTREGRGRMTYAGISTAASPTSRSTGEVYEGDWHDGFMSGYGLYRYASGAIYEGEFRANRRHGKGLMMQDGGIYEALWNDGVCVKKYPPPQTSTGGEGMTGGEGETKRWTGKGSSLRSAAAASAAAPASTAFALETRESHIHDPERERKVASPHYDTPPIQPFSNHPAASVPPKLTTTI